MLTVMTPPGSSLVELVVKDHLLLGASTGAFYEERGNWAELVERSELISTTAIELTALSEPELPGLMSYLRATGDLPFRFVSVHGPTKGLSLRDRDLVDTLIALPESIDAIVLHPDVLQDAAEFRRLGSRLVLENMDARKADGRTVSELAGYFEALPEARYCFDVAHAWSVDPSMELAHDLLDAFGPRLSHVHLSSVTNDCEHVPLSVEDLELFLPLLRRCQDVPWILEAYEDHQTT